MPIAGTMSTGAKRKAASASSASSRSTSTKASSRASKATSSRRRPGDDSCYESCARRDCRPDSRRRLRRRGPRGAPPAQGGRAFGHRARARQSSGEGAGPRSPPGGAAWPRRRDRRAAGQADRLPRHPRRRHRRRAHRAFRRARRARRDHRALAKPDDLCGARIARGEVAARQAACALRHVRRAGAAIKTFYGALAMLLAGAALAQAPAGTSEVTADGCKLYLPQSEAKSASRIRWSGQCKDGLAEGRGVVRIYSGGKISRVSESTFAAGKVTAAGESYFVRGGDAMRSRGGDALQIAASELPTWALELAMLVEDRPVRAPPKAPAPKAVSKAAEDQRAAEDKAK